MKKAVELTFEEYSCITQILALRTHVVKESIDFNATRLDSSCPDRRRIAQRHIANDEAELHQIEQLLDNLSNQFIFDKKQ